MCDFYSRLFNKKQNHRIQLSKRDFMVLMDEIVSLPFKKSIRVKDVLYLDNIRVVTIYCSYRQLSWLLSKLKERMSNEFLLEVDSSITDD